MGAPMGRSHPTPGVAWPGYWHIWYCNMWEACEPLSDRRNTRASVSVFFAGIKGSSTEKDIMCHISWSNNDSSSPLRDQDCHVDLISCCSCLVTWSFFPSLFGPKGKTRIMSGKKTCIKSIQAASHDSGKRGTSSTSFKSKRLAVRIAPSFPSHAMKEYAFRCEKKPLCFACAGLVQLYGRPLLG